MDNVTTWTFVICMFLVLGAVCVVLGTVWIVGKVFSELVKEILEWL